MRVSIFNQIIMPSTHKKIVHWHRKPNFNQITRHTITATNQWQTPSPRGSAQTTKQLTINT